MFWHLSLVGSGHQYLSIVFFCAGWPCLFWYVDNALCLLVRYIGPQEEEVQILLDNSGGVCSDHDDSDV